MKQSKLKNQSKEIALLRTKTIIISISVIFFVLFFFCLLNIFRIETTNMYNGTDLNAYAQEMYTEYESVDSQRGIITDTNGVQLAVNITTYNMYAILDPESVTLEGTPDYVSDPKATTDALIKVLGLEGDQEAYDLFYSQLSMDGVSQVEFGTYGKDLTITQKEEIEALNLPGIHFTENETRYYPYGNFASYVLGYVTPDENGNLEGQMGVEAAYDGYLRGVDGETVTETDAAGIPISDQQEELLVGADGTNIQLTIDAQIQSFVQTAVDTYYKEAKVEFDMAFTIVMDADDGAILAAYSLPSFDPNKRDVENYVNPFTQYCYEPGSTIKPFVAATAMEVGVWDADKEVEVDYRSEESWGTDSEGNPNYIADWPYNSSGSEWGTLTEAEGIYYSSNVAMSRILDDIGLEVYAQYMTETFLFGTAVENSSMLTLPCEYNPQYELDYYNTGFGQGMTVNAMQMLRAYSAFANEGKMVQPHIVESMTDPETGEVFYSYETDESMQPVEVISPDTASQMLDLLEGTVYYESENEGDMWDATGDLLQECEVKVGTKTGTAQIPADGTYSFDDGFISSYMTIAPIDDPEIIVYSVVVNPSTYPKVDFIPQSQMDIIEQTISYMNKDTSTVEVDLEDNNGVTVKDYTGMDIKVAEAELKEAGFQTYVIGTGNVTTQYPKSNQVISKDQVIVLKGNETFDYKKFVGMDYETALGICKVSNWECSFDGVGKITSVEKVTDTKYNLSTKVVEKPPSEEPKEVETDASVTSEDQGDIESDNASTSENSGDTTSETSVSTDDNSTSDAPDSSQTSE